MNIYITYPQQSSKHGSKHPPQIPQILPEQIPNPETRPTIRDLLFLYNTVIMLIMIFLIFIGVVFPHCRCLDDGFAYVRRQNQILRKKYPCRQFPGSRDLHPAQDIVIKIC